mmetsp:Transcript_35819/g.95136  ORF Transcript_35819/g.95136 Transcript_35819/m.95136 type:complete len:259 (+) Transcript_35819:247-1023(+)
MCSVLQPSRQIKFGGKRIPQSGDLILLGGKKQVHVCCPASTGRSVVLLAPLWREVASCKIVIRRRTNPIKAILHETHKPGESMRQTRMLVRQFCNIDALGTTLESQKTLNEFVNVHGVRTIGVHKFEERPGIGTVQSQCLEVCLHCDVRNAFLELQYGNVSRLVGVKHAEHRLNLFSGVLATGVDRLNDEVWVTLRSLNRTVAKHARDHVEHSKVGEGDERTEERHPQYAEGFQRIAHIMPTDTSRDGFEEGEHRRRE